MVSKILVCILPIVALAQAVYYPVVPTAQTLGLDAGHYKGKDNSWDLSQWNQDAVNGGEYDRRLLDEKRRQENALYNSDSTKAFNYNPYAGYGYGYPGYGGCPSQGYGYPGAINNYQNDKVNSAWNLDDMSKLAYMDRGSNYNGYHADGLNKNGRNIEVDKNHYNLNAAAVQGYPHGVPAIAPVAAPAVASKMYF